MKVIIQQTEPALLDVRGNLADVIAKIKSSREKGATLSVFPELALTGYFVGQQYHEAALKLNTPEISKLVEATRGTAAVVGFIEESPSLHFYNSALVAIDGQIELVHRKVNLPNYGVFEERKFFTGGSHIRVFKLECFRVAVFICNDLWHPSLPYLAVTQGADIFVNIFNSSHEAMGAEFSNIDSWSIINTFYSRVFGVYNICANRVGTESFRRIDADNTPDEPTSGNSRRGSAKQRSRFWGGSEIINPFGKRIAKADFDQADEISGDISRELVRKKRLLLPYLKNDDPYFTQRELRRILDEKSSGSTRTESHMNISC